MIKWIRNPDKKHAASLRAKGAALSRAYAAFVKANAEYNLELAGGGGTVIDVKFVAARKRP